MSGDASTPCWPVVDRSRKRGCKQVKGASCRQVEGAGCRHVKGAEMQTGQGSGDADRPREQVVDMSKERVWKHDISNCSLPDFDINKRPFA